MNIHWRLFFMRRIYGLAMILDGFVFVFTPWKTGLPLKVARGMARARGRRLMERKK